MNDTDADTPQLEHGFVQLSYEVLFAVCTHLGGAQGAILAQIIRDQYGARKQPEGRIDRQLTEQLGGVADCGVRQAVKRLVDKGVLTREGTGLRFTKDYRRWRTLNAEQCKGIRDQRYAHVTPLHQRHRQESERDTHVTEPLHPCHASVTPVSRPPIKRLREINTPEEVSGQSEASERGRGREPAPRPAAAGGVKVVRSEDRDALVELVALHWTDDFAERKFRRELPPILRAARGDVRIVEAAVKSASENDAADPVAWIVAKCRDYAEAGVPEDVAPTKNDTMSEAEAAAWKEILRGVGA